MKRCIWCRRPLKNKRSKILGMGPTCAKNFPGYAKRKLIEAAGQIPLFKEKKKKST